MGFYTIDSPVDYENLATFNNTAPTQGQRDYASAYVGGLEDKGITSTVGAAATFLIPDLIDTIASSVGATDRGKINQNFLAAIGSPGMNAWYESNKGAVELASGLAGTVLAGALSRGLLTEAGPVMNALRGVPYIKTVATLDTQLEKARRLAMLTQTRVALDGSIGIDRFAGGELIFSRLGQSALRTSRLASVKGFYRASAAKTFTQNLLAEGIMAATLNQNSMLYDDSLVHNLGWMAGGLAIGQAADSLMATYALRKMANADHIRQRNRGAYDVTGFETGRNNAFVVANAILEKADPGFASVKGFMFDGSGGVTDLVSNYAIQAAELNKGRGTSQLAQTLGANRESAATHVMSIAQKLMQKVTPRGVRGVADSGFHMDTEGLGPVIAESLARDPKSMLGIEELGRIPEGLTAERVDKLRSHLFAEQLKPAQEIMGNGGFVLKTRKTPTGKFNDEWIQLSDEEYSALQQRIDKLIFANSAVGKVMMEPGEWAPLSHVKIAEGYVPIKPELEGSLNKKDPRAFWTIRWGKRPSQRLSLGNDGSLILPEGKKQFEDLSNTEMLHAYAAAEALVKHHIRFNTQFLVQPKANWFQLDLAERIMSHPNGGDPSLVRYLDPKMTREQALVESLAQKVDAVNKATKNIDYLEPADVFGIKVRYNLPRVDSYTAALMNTDEHPLDLLLAGFRSGDEIRQLSHLDLLKALNDARTIKGFTDEATTTLKSLQGNSFNFLKDRDGNPIGPIIGYQRPMNPFEWSKDDLLIRHAVREAGVQAELISGSPIVSELVQFLTSSPSFNQARNVMELADDQQRSFVPGFRNAAPQTTLGAAINSITPRARRDVDSIPMLAASQQQDLKSRYMQTATKEIFESAMGDNISLINAPRNARSAMLLNQTWSHGQGWHFEAKPIQLKLPSGEDGYALVIDAKNRENQKRFQESFGRKLEEGQPLLSPAGAPVVMDDLAWDTHQRFQQVTKLVLEADNTLLKSQGLPLIAGRAHYIPPPELKGKYIAYTFDSNNNIISGLTAIADSSEGLVAEKAKVIQSPLWRDGYRIRSKDDIGEFMTLYDKAQMDWHDPLTTALQPGKVNQGRLAGPGINHQAFNEGLIRMRDKLNKIGDDVVDILFDQPLKSAKIRGELAKLETATGRQTAKHSSIYDRYEQNLRGRSALATSDSFLGDASRWLESRINGLINSPPAQVPFKIGQTFADWIRAAVPGKSPSGEQFDKFAKELGKYMPYKSATDMVEEKLGSRTPAEVKDIAKKLSWFEASHRLRWLESMHAVVNLSSMVANMPSVIRALQPRAGETIEEAALRNSSLTMVGRVNGENIVLPNGPKLVWASMLHAYGWKKVADPFIAEAERKSYRLGYMNQEVAEMNRSYGAIDSRDGWRGWMFGDPQAEGNSIRAKVARKGGLDKALGYLSDKSEDISRQWGMHAGFLVGRALGLENADDLISLGHELTNKMIANYDPRNRPEVFQGALGSLAGLFLSYMINFYTRMFRYIETGDGRALASQAAMQSAVFGVGSLPGWNALNWAFFDRGYAKGEDPVDSIYSRLGTDAGDLFLHGTLSNLPKLFGADGIALYTRGDISARLPGSQWTMIADTVPVPNLPLVDSMLRLGKGVYAGIGALNTGAPTSATQWAEIASNTVVNRPLAGIIEQLGTGDGGIFPGTTRGLDTSWDGQVVAKTHSTAESVYRWLGIRSEIQQKAVDAFYADKTAQEEQQARRDALNSATRAAIRARDLQSVPLLFEQYVKNGGDPRRYTSWVKDNTKYAMNTRSENRLAQALADKTNRSNNTIQRMLDGEVGITEGELSTEDYGQKETVDQIIQDSWEAAPQPLDTLNANNPISGPDSPSLIQ